MGKIQIISILASSLFLVVVVEAVRQRRMKDAYSLLWILLGGSFLVLAIWRNALELVSKFIGIYYPPSTLFLFMLCSLFLIVFQYSLLLTKRSDDIRNLSQSLALVEERLRQLEKKHEVQKDSAKDATQK